MKFQIVFENSGDSIPFSAVYNHDLLEHFINHVDFVSKNKFLCQDFVSKASKLINDVKKNVEKTNEILPALIDQEFALPQQDIDLLNRDFLNQLHWHWVKTQAVDLDIDHMRFSKKSNESAAGTRLHDMYPDEIRKIKVAEAMKKLDYIDAYEEVNLSVHRLEKRLFNCLEFVANDRYAVFDNPFANNMTTNQDVVNFYFGYTYVGRQTYDKFICYDTTLDYDDHYNYEQLELTFHVNLEKPQTVPFSKEFVTWCNCHNIKPVGTQIPIGNIDNLEENLFKFRSRIWHNLNAGNSATLQLTWRKNNGQALWRLKISQRNY